MLPSVVLQRKPFLVLSLWLTALMIWNLKLNLILNIWILTISNFCLNILISFQISVTLLLPLTNCGFCVWKRKPYHLYCWTTYLQYNCHPTQSSPDWSHLSAWIRHWILILKMITSQFICLPSHRIWMMSADMISTLKIISQT